MPPPDLSIVVPALNEQRQIPALIERVRTYLTASPWSWELVVIDDGSADQTAAMVEQEGRRDSRVRLVRGERRGKGAAVRRGLLEARGNWRFMADADLAVPIDQLPRFMHALTDAQADIVIGSREAAGAERVGESAARHALGRVFNAVVQAIALPGIADTQCGFKMLRRSAAERILPLLTIDGFAFDVEMLFIARRAGLRIVEVGVVCQYEPGSRVNPGRGAKAFADVLRIRWNAWRGRYRAVTASRAASL